jgi:hypothetical protein
LAGHPAAAVKTEIEVVFEDLNYEELKRRANSRLPDRVVATLEAHGERRSVAAGEALYRVEDRQYPLVYAISAQRCAKPRGASQLPCNSVQSQTTTNQTQHERWFELDTEL